VNQKYVAQIAKDASLLGKKAPIPLTELEAAASALQLVIATLVDAC